MAHFRDPVRGRKRYHLPSGKSKGPSSTIKQLRDERQGIASSLKAIETQANSPYAGPAMLDKALNLKRQLIAVSIKIADESIGELNRSTTVNALERKKNETERRAINEEKDGLGRINRHFEDWSELRKKQPANEAEEAKIEGRIKEIKRRIKELEKQLE